MRIYCFLHIFNNNILNFRLFSDEEQARMIFKETLWQSWPKGLEKDDIGDTYNDCVRIMRYQYGARRIIIICDQISDHDVIRKILEKL